MSSAPTKTLSRRRLLMIALVALTITGGVAAYGIIQRAHSAAQVAQWTDQQAIPTVALARLRRGPGVRKVTLPGTIQAYYRAAIYARVSGYLQSWQADIGAHVKGGQLLASIDTPDLDQEFAQAKADLATATANAQLAAVTAERWNALVKLQWVSKQTADDKNGSAAATKATMDAASANVKRLEAMEGFKNIVAPFDGVVTARKTDIGALINAGNAGQELFEVSDLHKVRIYVQVPQAFTAELQPGLQATFEMRQYPGQQFDAKVVTTSNAMELNSRSMLVELQADNADGKLFAGAYCQVHFQLPNNPNEMRVPATALVPADRGAQVALLGNDGKAVLKPVQLGRDFGDSVEVVAGLSPSDRVIDSPPETLQSGDQVQLAATTPLAKQAAALPSPTKAD
jgi:RND family efflux transporter MFP subunit